MYCRECKWFESGYTSNSSGVCVVRGAKIYPSHFCWLSSDSNRRTKLGYDYIKYKDGLIKLEENKCTK